MIKRTNTKFKWLKLVFKVQNRQKSSRRVWWGAKMFLFNLGGPPCFQRWHWTREQTLGGKSSHPDPFGHGTEEPLQMELHLSSPAEPVRKEFLPLIFPTRY